MIRSAVTDEMTCLNGWWDFIPVYLDTDESEVPSGGWLRSCYMVPSFWTKPLDGVRKPGEVFFRENKDVFDGETYEFLFDAYNYPLEWSKTRSGWVRRTFSVEPIEQGERYFLRLEAVTPRYTLFVNGVEISRHIHPTLPLEVDVTGYLSAGDNEIAVFIEDFERDENDRAMVPSGNWIPHTNSGIWQDVYLIKRSDVYLSDITIRTSTRFKSMHVAFEITNLSDRERTIRVDSAVVDWAKDLDPSLASVALELPERTLTVSPNGSSAFEVEVNWPDAQWWYPENPKLYQIRTSISEDNKPLHVSFERFGFREVWIDGPQVMLNDYPMHLFSDWGHKMTLYHHTEKWIRQWFGMIRDANMNHSRLHTHPHPRIYLDLADEEGILITGETGVFGAGGTQAGDSPLYWDNARDHIRQFVKRDKNHPSIIMWSVENEMRWNRDETSLTLQELPKLKELFNDIDPTRPAYHEGDSSLWNEKHQDIISRHYGNECSGTGWWNKKQPLHSGEMCLYHYAGPNSTLHLGGDLVFKSFKAVDEAAATDAAYIIEEGRVNGVCCFGPWNLSCLENLRMNREKIDLHYDDFSAPGVKPLQVPAHSSEFSFWESGKGYTPNYSFNIQAHAFRPLAVIDTSRRSSYFAGARFKREVYVVNDTAESLFGELELSLTRDGAIVFSQSSPVSVMRGQNSSIVMDFALDRNLASGIYKYCASFTADGKVMDRWDRDVKIYSSAIDSRNSEPFIESKVAVYGNGQIENILSLLDIDFDHVDSLDLQSLVNARVLIMEKNSVIPGSSQNVEVKDFVRNGGRLILLEQKSSLFPGIKLEEKPVLKAFPRCYEHEILSGIAPDDLFAWSDNPFTSSTDGSYLAERMYRKDDGTRMMPVLDSGEGGFGLGNLDYTPLFESACGDGLIIACQLRLDDKIADIPAAEQIFLNMLKRADSYRPCYDNSPLLVYSADKPLIADLVRQAESGRTVIVADADEAALRLWGEALGVDLHVKNVGEVYQLVRAKDDAILNGVSNEDTCGIETYTYVAPDVQNYRVGKTFLAHTDGLEAILETPQESCLRELFVESGKTEPLRAHTMSRFLYAEKPDKAVGLGRVRVGEGEIIFNQFAPEGTLPRFARLMNRIRSNIGIESPGTILDGDTVPVERNESQGYPNKVYIYNGPCDQKLFDEMLESTCVTMERMASRPILNTVCWQEVSVEDGIWSASGLDSSQKVFIYYIIDSPTVRKKADQMDIGVANPAALTYLQLQGRGDIELIVDCCSYGKADLSDGEARISNIFLEKGFNHVLVKWTPDSTNSTLNMQWQDISRRPEIGLRFC